MNPIRPESLPAQVDSGEKIIRVRESGGSLYRMKWNGGAYSITGVPIVVYEDSGNTPVTFESDEERLAVWRSASQRWEVWTDGSSGGGGGGGGDEVERFTLTATKAITDVAGDAVISGTATAIKVVEPVSTHPRYAGYGPYTDPLYGAEPGYSGMCVKFTSNYSGSGLAGYYILTMEGQARWIAGTAGTAKSVSDDFAKLTLFEVGGYCGAFPNNRRPAHGLLIGGGSGGSDLAFVDVYHPTLAADKWALALDQPIVARYDEQQGKYLLEPHEPRIVSGQATAAVADTDAVFQIDNIYAITPGAPLPPEPLEVLNDHQLTLADNDKVYAIQNYGGSWNVWGAKGAAGAPGTPGDDGESTLIADFTATATSSAASATITGDIVKSWGGTPAATTGVTVHKLSDHATTIFSGDKFRAIWDSVAERWELFWFDGMRITVKGTIAGSQVNSGTSTFTLSSPTLVNGWRLPGSITVTNDPPIHAEVGQVVEARFNLTVGSGPTTNWDTGSGFNFLHKLRGIGGYNSGLREFNVQWADDNPEWTAPSNDEDGLVQLLGKNASNALVYYTAIECNPSP